MNNNLLKRYQDILVPLIKKRLPSCRIHLLDAKAHADPDSEEDIELVLDAGRIIDPQILVMLYDDIDQTENPLDIEIDLVDAYAMTDAECRAAKKDSAVWGA